MARSGLRAPPKDGSPALRDEAKAEKTGSQWSKQYWWLPPGLVLVAPHYQQANLQLSSQGAVISDMSPIRESAYNTWRRNWSQQHCGRYG
ncbi:hypothetical protein LMH87_003611 [Akanthomyces muscarius]|uniref:Uncharacterized protein n=1 Tax=Akanthomyces muscarius TaxID=2231603 RepID=A0A9W8Q247_AKAMU|nr:hypothetical protein LMH87_003611 [Akanthomyces muscarius]KAJ4144740.1 hypothetical protein LMH87_003611 [Akanthomyces muscarius]